MEGGGSAINYCDRLEEPTLENVLDGKSGGVVGSNDGDIDNFKLNKDIILKIDVVNVLKTSRESQWVIRVSPPSNPQNQ